MKFFPLIWAALWRKPARTILILLAVTMAFTLFGTMIGFNASVQRIVNGAFPERIYVYSRFGNGALGYTMPLAYREQILRLPGIAKIAYRGGLEGYYRDPVNHFFVYMISEDWCATLPEYNLTPARCHQLQASRTGVLVTRLIAARYHLKPGDAFPVLTAAVTRQDGGKLWPFTVIGVLDDIPREPSGYIVGTYAYLDQSELLARRGTVGIYDIDISKPDPDQAAATARAIEAMFANSADPVHADTEVAEVEEASQSGVNIAFVTMVVAGAGLFMVLFLAGNGIYQSVRERIAEFAVLKTLGFTDAKVMGLVFTEAAIPCLIGAGLGLGLAAEFARQVPKLMPPDFYVPAPYMSAPVFAVAFAAAVLVALFSAVIPAWRLKRLNVAAALSGK